MRVGSAPSRGRHVAEPWRPSSFRQAVRLVLLTALVPGYAQAMAGRRDRRIVGWVAIGVWAALLLTLLVTVAAVLVLDGAAALASVAARPRVLRAAEVVTIGVACA